MEHLQELNIIDKAIDKAQELTQDVDQQWWYQEGYRDGVDDILSKIETWFDKHYWLQTYKDELIGLI